MFQEIQITAYQCECEICYHQWTSKKDALPTHCPNRKCSNPTKWNKGGNKKHEDKKPVSTPKVADKSARTYNYASQTVENLAPEQTIDYNEDFGA